MLLFIYIHTYKYIYADRQINIPAKLKKKTATLELWLADYDKAKEGYEPNNGECAFAV